MENLTVEGVIFKKRNEYGDFNWMINHKDYNDCLFIFNDNTECHNNCYTGAGNAIIRQYNKHNKNIEKPRSCGIPTGSLKRGGFDELNDTVKKIIDTSIDEIIEIIKKYDYKKVYYSRDDKEEKLGTSIFKVNDDVINYITEKIKNLINLTK